MIKKNKMSKPIDKKFKKSVNNSAEVNASNKQVEDALRESEEKYRTLTENIKLGIFRSTPGSKGKFIEVNSAFAKMLGYKSKKKLFERSMLLKPIKIRKTGLNSVKKYPEKVLLKMKNCI